MSHGAGWEHLQTVEVGPGLLESTEYMTVLDANGREIGTLYKVRVYTDPDTLLAAARRASLNMASAMTVQATWPAVSLCYVPEPEPET